MLGYCVEARVGIEFLRGGVMLTRRSDLWKLILFTMLVVVATSAGSQQPAVDGATIRESLKASDRNGVHTQLVFDGHRFTARNASITTLLDFAYGLGLGAALINAPDWTRSAKYDVDATVVPGKSGDHDVTFARQAQPSLIAALQQKFHLTAHLEPRPGNALALLVAKGRPRLKLVSASAYSGPGVRQAGFGVLEGKAATMDELASSLGSYGATGSMPPVVNSTGLAGRYDFTLHWSPLASVNLDDGGAVRYNLDGSPSARASDSRCVLVQEAAGCSRDEALPPLQMALESELGLKLEPAKMTVESLVIDHIEKPALP
jgi:uncharacterized protein (TIGR03435 family)